MELPREQVGPVQVPADRRRDPKVRRQMSGPAMRTFLEIAAAWRLTGDETRGLLGWPPVSTYFKYKAGQVGVLARWIAPGGRSKV